MPVDGHVEVREEHDRVDEHADAHDAQDIAEDIGRIHRHGIDKQRVDRAQKEQGGERYSHHL